MSPGNRSLVNWMRENDKSSDRASAWASVVLPTPGTSSSSKWPDAASAASDSSMTSCFPRSARATFACSALASRAASAGPSGEARSRSSPPGRAFSDDEPSGEVTRSRLTRGREAWLASEVCESAPPWVPRSKV